MDDLLARARPILSTTPDRWTALTKSLPADLLTLPPAPGQWSAVDCLRHMLDTEQVFQQRVRAFQEGRASFPAFDPERQGSQPGEQPPQSMAEEFARRRAESLRLLASVQPDDYTLQSRHQELGPVTLGQLIAEWAAHDLNHTVQAERALMQPYIRDCGPWRVYFTDHLASA